jgi:hypothetical protein
MPQSTISPAEELHKVIERLPLRTRSAMLDAVRSPRASLIAGAYVDGDGGTCPLLPAHRRGGRVNDDAAAASRFAGLWDLFTGTRSGAPRPIEEGERQALESMLTASVARERRRRAEAKLERARAERVRERDRERRERAGREAIVRIRHGFGARGWRARS